MKNNLRMKRLLIVPGFLCLCILIFFVLKAGLSAKYAPDTMLDRTTRTYAEFHHSSHVDYALSPYDAMYARATTVALVTPEDDLAVENSFEPHICEIAYSYRTLKVLRYFKNTKEQGDLLEVSEDCALGSDGVVYATDGCYPTIKGDVYLVFLAEKEHGRLHLPPGCEGAFNLTYLRANENRDAVLDALNALGLLVCGEKDQDIVEHYFLSTPGERVGEACGELAWKTVRLGTKYTKASMYISLDYCQTETGYLFRI